MNQVKVLDKVFRKSISHNKIIETVARMAADLDRDLMGKNPLFLSVLNGSFIFSSDLFKMLLMPCTISFVKMSSYEGDSTTGKVKELIGLSEDIKDK